MEKNDIVTKEFEAYPDVAADILNALLHEGKKAVRERNLLPAPTETLYRGSLGSRNQLEDLAKYEFIDRELTMVYLFANQTAVDSRMLIRKAGYVGGYYREQYDAKIGWTCPVLELVLYWGKKRWSGPQSIRRMFCGKKIPGPTWDYIDDMKLHVWEMRHLPAEVRERFTSDMRIVVDYLAEGDSYRTDRKVVHKKALIDLLRSLSGDEEFDDTQLFMKEMDIREEDEITMGGLFDQYVWKGRAEGRAEGRREGRTEGTLSVMRSVMKELHLTVEETLKAAGIPEEEWEQYGQQLADGYFSRGGEMRHDTQGLF